MRIKIKFKAGSLKVKARGMMPFTLDEPAQHFLSLSLTLGLSTEITNTFEMCAVAHPKLSGNPPTSARSDYPGIFIGAPSPPPAACPPY